MNLSTFIGAIALLVVVTGCHPADVCRGKTAADAAECCGKRDPAENNCQACASQPMCGWCDSPVAGEPRCMSPEIGEKECKKPVITTTADCPGPPVMPPGGVGGGPPASASAGEK